MLVTSQMEERMKARSVLVAVLAVSGISPAWAGGAIGAVIPPANLPEQIVQEVTSVSKLAKQAESVEEQIQEVENQVTNMVDMPMSLYHSLTAPIGQLINVVNQAQGLAYAAQNIPGEFESEYGQGASELLPQGYSESLQQWTQNEHQATETVLQKFGMTTNDFANTQAALQTLTSASQSASGRKAVLQAANQIAAMQVEQIQSLQSTVMSGLTPLYNYYNNRSSEQLKEQQSIQGWLKGAGNTTGQNLM